MSPSFTLLLFKNPKIELRVSRLGLWNLTLQGLRVLRGERRVKGESYPEKEDRRFCTIALPALIRYIQSLCGPPTLSPNAGEGEGD